MWLVLVWWKKRSLHAPIVIEIHNDDMIRNIAAATVQSSQLLRALQLIQKHASTKSWTYARSADIDGVGEDCVYEQ